jgi:DNA (cytosine-5)-methyltransferase 1
MKILELFSGYGTASFALKELGIDYELVGYSDVYKYANQCFKQNHCPNDTEDKLRLGDVKLIDPNKLEDFDLLTGGFPCQAFSVAGKGLGELDPRGTLFYEIIRIAEVKKPRYMLLENVKGLTSKKFKTTFDKILSELDRIGYKVHWKVLNTKDYGIPQNRERVWFVCFREQSDYDKFKFPDKEELKIFIKDILEENRNEISIKNKKLKLILDSPTGKEDPCFELTGDTPSGLSRQKDRIYSKISPCLNCTIEEVLVNINGKIIKLNGKEHFRLQGFLKDNINISGLNERVIKKLAGNGQSLNVVTKIFKEMLK